MADILTDDRLYGTVAVRTGIGTSELNVMLFRNFTGSTRTVTIKQIVVANTHTVTSNIRFRIYVGATVTTTGTALTEGALDVGSGNTPSAEAFSSPTTSATGTLVYDLTATAFGPACIVDVPDGFRLRVGASTNILVTAVADGTSRVANVSILWEEN